MFLGWRIRHVLMPGVLFALGCGTVEEAPIVEGPAQGGSGGSASGGASASGGSTAAGGTGGVASGATGGTGFGGTSSTGGSTPSGGLSSDGGSSGDGGTSGDGGAAAGGAIPETGGTASGGSGSSGVCGGDTPHGCYVARPDNPSGCPPQIHEQSAFFPPPNEWVTCTSLPYVPCVYDKPEGGEAECRCNLGEHWLCSY